MRRRELELRRRKARGKKLVIISVVIMAIIGVSVYFAVSGGGGSSTQSNESIKATWVTAWVVGDTVSIPVSKVESNWNIHFKLGTQGGDINFMTYIVDGEIYVRANACPPCRSVGFSLQRDILVCDTCRTTFKAKTGDGVQGACVDFPKASVPYEITDGGIVMSKANLIAAYQDTLNPGWP